MLLERDSKNAGCVQMSDTFVSYLPPRCLCLGACDRAFVEIEWLAAIVLMHFGPAPGLSAAPFRACLDVGLLRDAAGINTDDNGQPRGVQATARKKLQAKQMPTWALVAAQMSEARCPRLR